MNNVNSSVMIGATVVSACRTGRAVCCSNTGLLCSILTVGVAVEGESIDACLCVSMLSCVGIGLAMSLSVLQIVTPESVDVAFHTAVSFLNTGCPG
jgi:hypothetical protein